MSMTEPTQSPTEAGETYTLTYPGDATALVGETRGPSTDGRWFKAAAAERTDDGRTRVMFKRLTAALTAIAAVLLLAGCGSNNLRDLEGVSSTDPDWVRLINSPDGHPNVTLYCANGIGYATTTRDYDAFVLVPDLNDFCATKAPK